MSRRSCCPARKRTAPRPLAWRHSATRPAPSRDSEAFSSRVCELQAPGAALLLVAAALLRNGEAGRWGCRKLRRRLRCGWGGRWGRGHALRVSGEADRPEDDFEGQAGAADREPVGESLDRIAVRRDRRVHPENGRAVALLDFNATHVIALSEQRCPTERETRTGGGEEPRSRLRRLGRRRSARGLTRRRVIRGSSSFRGTTLRSMRLRAPCPHVLATPIPTALAPPTSGC
jgi:hypothetical protein